jgi:hypothetical protein
MGYVRPYRRRNGQYVRGHYRRNRWPAVDIAAVFVVVLLIYLLAHYVH